MASAQKSYFREPGLQNNSVSTHEGCRHTAHTRTMLGARDAPPTPRREPVSGKTRAHGGHRARIRNGLHRRVPIWVGLCLSHRSAGNIYNWS